MSIEKAKRDSYMKRNALAREDVKRAQDRHRVHSLRSNKSRKSSLKLLWLLVGPGILVMLGENDGPSMISYATTGATYGIGFFLPFIILTFAMAFVIQEMTVRLGAATKHGHAELISARFGQSWGVFAMVDLLIGNLLTLVTEFIAISAGLSFFGIAPVVSVFGAFLLIIAITSSRRYWTWERVTLGFALFNLVFVPIAVIAHPVQSHIIAAFLNWGPIPRGVTGGFLLLVMSNIGATVTPWMLFFQQSATVDKGMTTEDIRHGRIDTALGALIASVAAIATVLTTSLLFTHHINTSSFQGADFAHALQPFIGQMGATLFALGIFEAGLVAAIAISSSSAYAFGEITHRSHSLNSSFREAWPFYAVMLAAAGIAGSLVLIPHAPLVFIVLLVNVIATLSMPPAIIFLLLLVNDREIMGVHVNKKLGNILGLAIALFLILIGVAFGIITIFPHLLPA